MNRYLAICHALAQLEFPTGVEQFENATQNKNPLFESSCLTARDCLEWLYEEGLLLEQQEAYQLSPHGQILYQHLLKWTARDKAAVQQAKTSRREISGEAPIQPECPVCTSDLCSHYLFMVLLDHFYADLAAWNAQQKAFFRDLLSQHFANQDFYLLSDTQPLSELSEFSQERLQLLLQNHSELVQEAELVADFMQQAIQRQVLPDLSALKQAQRVSRIRFERGLMALEELQQLRQAAYPSLFSGLERRNQQPFVRVSKPGFNPEQDRALVYLSDGTQEELLLLSFKEQGWQITQRLAY